MFTQFIVLLCLELGLVSCKAPLTFADHPDAIPSTYIAVLGEGELAARTVSQVLVEDRYNINGWRAAKVVADEMGLEALLHDPAVQYVEADRMSVKIDEIDDTFDPMHNVMRGFVSLLEKNQDACQTQDSTDYVWGLTRTSSRALPSFPTGQYSWEDDTDGSGVDVYIVDTGIYLQHNDFGGRARHLFTAPGISEGDNDLNSHGTHVGGTAAGNTFGVAKNANLLAVKVLNQAGSGSVSDLIAGVNAVTSHHEGKGHRKSVMNLSLGVSPPSEPFEGAIRNAVLAGVNTCVSARNNNRDSCVDSPSRMPEVITTAASTITDTLPSFTNFGPCVNITAPGNSVRSAGITGPDSSTLKSGTSMAAPHVAGVVARYLSGFADNDVPSTWEVGAWIAETATKDVLTLVPPKDTTPNRLLYMAC